MRPPVLNHSLSRRPSRDWDWSDRMQQLKRYSPLLVGISLLILFSGAWSSSGSGANGMSPHGGHIVVIDAGSSGSRAHVFAYNGQGVVNPAHESLKTKPGLSSYAKTPDQAGASLEPLLKFAREHIPADEIARTKIVLKATAGMRLLDKADQKAVMRNVQDFLKQSDFAYGVAEVIDGKEEGLLGWMAVNYLNNQQNAGNGNSGNWGVLEMGGASVQYTVPLASGNKIAKEHQRFYRDPTSGAPGQVFTHSFIGLGMQSARQAVNQALQSKGAATDPCLYTHYIEEHDANEFSGVAAIPPAGDFQQCVAMIEQTLFATQASCTNCLFNGIVAPDMANVPLWAFENFYYTTSGLGVFTGGTGRIQISDIVTAGQQICATDWSEVDTTYPKDGQDKTDNEKWCFGAAYLSTFLTKGLGLSPQQELTVGNSVGDNGIDWALGAAVLEAASGNNKKKGMLRSS